MSTSSLSELQQQLRAMANPQRAQHSLRFFKTGKGEYGEGDQFLGITVPSLRKLARQFRDLSVNNTENLLGSAWHEERLTALLLLMQHFARGDSTRQKQIYDTYLRNTQHINNWDLVDISAAHIVGAYLFHHSRQPLFKLVRSDSLWERRIAIVASHHFIRQQDFDCTLQLATHLLEDREDLIHKASGWMLREVGKRNLDCEERFLRKHYRNMPRTMLRYAIERFPEELRQAYLQGRI